MRDQIRDQIYIFICSDTADNKNQHIQNYLISCNSKLEFVNKIESTKLKQTALKNSVISWH